MSMKRILCLILALTLCGALAFAEGDDLETQLKAANERIAELEAQVELYRPFYDAQIVAEYDGGVIMLEEALEAYNYFESMYANYGISLADYGLEDQYKQAAVDSLLEQAVLDLKAAELGLDQLDEETLATLNAEAEENYEAYINSVLSYFSGEGVTEEKAREQSIAYLDSMGYTLDAMLESMVANYVNEALYNYVIADVAVSDEDVQSTYETLIADAEESYSNDYNYVSARNSGETILWNPEGYRQVKHVLVKFTDEQAASYSDLTDTIETLEAELAAIENPSEETTEETEVRTADEVTEELETAQADLEALYAELLPVAEEVVEKFNAGTAFADLIAEYNEDPGMTSEPTATLGYAIHPESNSWDPAFLAGAIAIPEIGGISEPVYGANGIHIIYYESDVAAGPVALDTVRDYVEQSAYGEKVSSLYNSTVTSWISALNPIYHYDRLAG